VATLRTTDRAMKTVRSALTGQLHVFYGSQNRAITASYKII